MALEKPAELSHCLMSKRGAVLESTSFCYKYFQNPHASHNLHPLLSCLLFMAEEKQGQEGTNPPLEQPNEPLPSECQF